MFCPTVFIFTGSDDVESSVSVSLDDDPHLGRGTDHTVGRARSKRGLLVQWGTITRLFQKLTLCTQDSLKGSMKRMNDRPDVAMRRSVGHTRISQRTTMDSHRQVVVWRTARQVQMQQRWRVKHPNKRCREDGRKSSRPKKTRREELRETGPATTRNQESAEVSTQFECEALFTPYTKITDKESCVAYETRLLGARGCNNSAAFFLAPSSNKTIESRSP